MACEGNVTPSRCQKKSWSSLFSSNTRGTFASNKRMAELKPGLADATVSLPSSLLAPSLLHTADSTSDEAWKTMAPLYWGLLVVFAYHHSPKYATISRRSGYAVTRSLLRMPFRTCTPRRSGGIGGLSVLRLASPKRLHVDTGTGLAPRPSQPSWYHHAL